MLNKSSKTSHKNQFELKKKGENDSDVSRNIMKLRCAPDDKGEERCALVNRCLRTSGLKRAIVSYGGQMILILGKVEEGWRTLRFGPDGRTPH